MFKHSQGRRRRSSIPIVIFRLILSLVMMVVLGVGVYQAFRYFSGVDPLNNPELPTEVRNLKDSPQTALFSLLSSGKTPQILSRVLGTKAGRVIPAQPVPASPTVPSFKFAIVADSHNDNGNLGKALGLAKGLGAKFVIGLGDYTEVGTKEELLAAKKVFDSSGLPYYTTAGDHDLWDARDKGSSSASNFTEVFGPPYQSFSDSNIRFVIIYNSDNYEGIDSLQSQWISEALSGSEEQPQKTLVFLHEPLYHPSSDHMMGKVTPVLSNQARELLLKLYEVGVAEVFAGDLHSFTRYQDQGGLKMTTVGALNGERNTQSARFAMVDVYQDGSYNIEDLEIK